jgi:hypothetical protein
MGAGHMSVPWVTARDLPAAVIARAVPAAGTDDEQAAGWRILDDAALTASAALNRITGGRWAGRHLATVELTPLAQAPALCPPLRRYAYAGVSPTTAELATNGAYVLAPELRLPDWPVRHVAAVTSAGVALDPAAYELLSGRILRRVDGGRWGVTVVAYVWGDDPPADARSAAVAFGAELALARLGAGGECRLPARVQTITRQNVTMALLDPMDLFDAGRTGIPEVDVWLGGVRSPGYPPVAWSPDVDARVRRYPSPVLPQPRRDIGAVADRGLTVEFRWVTPAGDAVPTVTPDLVARFRASTVAGVALLDVLSTAGAQLTETGPGVFVLALSAVQVAALPPVAVYELTAYPAGQPDAAETVAGGLLVSVSPLVAALP